jgi:prevent-host-death family protein
MVRTVTDPRKVAIMTQEWERIGVRELKAHLSAKIDAVQRGKIIVVTKHGQDVAVLGCADGGPSGGRDVRSITDAKAYRTLASERDGALAEVIQLRQAVAKLQNDLDEAREDAANARELAGTAAPRKRGWGRTA